MTFREILRESNKLRTHLLSTDTFKRYFLKPYYHYVTMTKEGKKGKHSVCMLMLKKTFTKTTQKLPAILLKHGSVVVVIRRTIHTCKFKC